MEAKDTVMCDEEIVDKTLEVNPCKSCQLAGSWTLACGYSHRGKQECIASRLFKSGCEAQAEISFRAGEEQQALKAIKDFATYAQSGELDKRFREIKLLGIMEVVEWVCANQIFTDIDEWQAKLKEWGIEEKKDAIH